MNLRTVRQFRVIDGQVENLRAGLSELRRRPEEVLSALRSEGCLRHAMYVVKEGSRAFLLVERIDSVHAPKASLSERWVASGNAVYLLLDTIVTSCLDWGTLEYLAQDLVISGIPETLFTT